MSDHFQRDFYSGRKLQCHCRDVTFLNSTRLIYWKQDIVLGNTIISISRVIKLFIPFSLRRGIIRDKSTVSSFEHRSYCYNRSHKNRIKSCKMIIY